MNFFEANIRVLVLILTYLKKSSAAILGAISYGLFTFPLIGRDLIYTMIHVAVAPILFVYSLYPLIRQNNNETVWEKSKKALLMLALMLLSLFVTSFGILHMWWNRKRME